MQTLWGLQYLRAVAALSVLFFHAALGAGGHDALGTGGVDIFFVISGFLMFELASLEPKPAQFAFARLKRIVPAYWIVTGIVALIQVAGHTERSVFDAAHLIKSLLFIPDMDVVRGKAYPTLIVGWTLNYEMFFYALVTGLLLLGKAWRLPALLLVFAGLFAARIVVPNPSVALNFYSDPIILEFAFGAALSELWRRKWLPHGGAAFAIVGALLMVSPQPSMLPRFIGYGVPALMIVMGMLAVELHRPIQRISALKLLGDASYSIYLWHVFVVAAVYRILGTAPPAFALAAIGGVGAGLASYWAIEIPIRTGIKGLDNWVKKRDSGELQ